MKRRFSILLLLFGPIFYSEMRGQSDEQSYAEEFTYGINFNTNAGLIGGLNFKWAKANGPKQFRCFGFELVNVKNPKEYRVRNEQTGNSFLQFKTNYLFVLRPYYGREFTLFRKAAEEGVHINAILAGGPSIGMLKPYYVLYSENPRPPGGGATTPPTSVPYTKDLTIRQIEGVGNFTDGINEIKFTPGIHAKASLTFEFGQIKNSVVGLETGIMLEQFTRTQEIMAYAPNRSFFFSSFLTLYYGKKY